MSDERPLLPDQTADDTDEDWARSAGDDDQRSNDERLKRDRPPHYDRSS